jgi:hypothetical protein
MRLHGAARLMPELWPTRTKKDDRGVIGPIGGFRMSAKRHVGSFSVLLSQSIATVTPFVALTSIHDHTARPLDQTSTHLP